MRALVCTCLVAGLGLLAPTALAAPRSVEHHLVAAKRATHTGRWDAAIRDLRRAMAAARRGQRAVDQARLAVELARVVIERNFYLVADRPRATRAADDALALAEAARDERVLAQALLQRARLAYTAAREDKAWDRPTALTRRARRLFERTGDRAGVASALYMLGLIEQMQERREPARALFERQIAIADQIGDKEILANGHRHLGFVYQNAQEWTRAARQFELSLRLSEEIGSAVTVPFAMATLAELEWSQLGRKQEALARLERAVRLARRARSTRAEYQARLLLARCLLELGRRDAALVHARAARAGARRFGSQSGQDEAEELLRAHRIR
jgi:tetratricopeptide (TPR) repeat protein